MVFRSIEFGSEDFQKEFCLRDEVLRVPLGMSLHDEDLSSEKDQDHFGLFNKEGVLVASVIAVMLPPDGARIRQMAVGGDFQRQGHGQDIIRRLEAVLIERGVRHVHMHARMNALDFYRKLGYSAVGPEFKEVGIPHVMMERELNPL